MDYQREIVNDPHYFDYNSEYYADKEYKPDKLDRMLARVKIPKVGYKPNKTLINKLPF